MSRKKVYLIPGTQCNEQLWSYILPDLATLMADTYEFVHVKIPKNKCFSEISDYLDGYFKEERVIIIGFSLGGYIATHFAVNFPERVDKIFSIANSPCALHPAEEKQRQEIVEYVKLHGYKGMSKTRAKQLLDSNNTDSEQLALFIDIMLSMDAALGEAELISQMRFTSERRDLYKKLASTKFQSVFYYSEDDAFVDITCLEKLERINANCTTLCTSGASHMLPLERPEELIRHISNWLK